MAEQGTGQGAIIKLFILLGPIVPRSRFESCLVHSEMKSPFKGSKGLNDSLERQAIIIMANTNYRKGRAKEYRVRKKLEAEGYVVLRTAGSHGFADLIAIGFGRVRFIQVKPSNFSKLSESRLLIEHSAINGTFDCSFEVM